MEGAEVEKATSSEDVNLLSRNRSFKSKQLVRSQAIRESQSPPRALSPAQRNDTCNVASNDTCDVAPNVAATNSDVRTVSVTEDNSSHFSGRSSDVICVSDVKTSDSDGCKKKPVEIQITSGAWEAESQCDQRLARRWASQASHAEDSRDLLSNSPRVACVCGACANCPHCRGRRRRHICPIKQDSGYVCSDDCADCSDTEQPGGGTGNDTMRKSTSLDVEDQTYYCRCPERKERPKNISISKNESDERTEPTGPELVNFIKETLNKNPRDRIALLKIEKELHSLVNDTGRCIVRFPVMTSYGRMLVHRCASLFQLSHHLDQTNKTCVLVSKSGTSGGRIPCTSFKEWCVASFVASPQRHQPDSNAKSILKRDTHSLDEPGSGVLASNRSKSLEQRERDYERVRRRIFSSDNCAHQDEYQWPWLNSGPVKLLTPETGRNKLLKVQSLESSGSGNGSSSSNWRGRGPVSKSHSFGGYGNAEPPPHRLLSRQGDLASSSWRLSPSSSGYKTLSLRSTDSITPSPTGGASPEPARADGVLCCVTELAAVPRGALVLHPQTGRPLTNPDGTVYHFDPANPPALYEPSPAHCDRNKMDQNNEKRRGRLEKQHSFIDNDCECQPSEECRSKCCCECRRHDACQQRTTSEKVIHFQETNTKPPSPPPYEATTPNVQESTNQKPPHEPPTNHKSPSETTQRQYESPPNQMPVYDTTANQKFETQRNFESTNQRPGNDARQKLTNQESQEMQYTQAYVYRTDEQVTSPPQVSQYAQAHMANVPIQDPNIRPMSLTNMVYPAAVPQGYPYQCRVEQPMQPVYQTLVQPHEDQTQMTPSPHAAETTFRIDPSYPYAAVDYTAACGACVDTTSLQHQQRSYNVGYGQMEAAMPSLPPYPIGNVMLPQPQLQPYPCGQYGENMGWAGKLVLPDMYPLVQLPQPHYPHYGLMYQQVIPQPYPVCQPVYPLVEKQPEMQRRNSVTGNRPSKRNSISGSSRNTPSQEEKVPYEEKNTEIAVKIQQIKNQMAQLNTRDKDRQKREEWRRRNSGGGLLGNYPVANNLRVVGRSNTNDESQLSSAARAIVNSIRNMQAKNTYQDGRRPERPERYECGKERPERRRPDRDEFRPAPPPAPPAPQYRHPYLLRQMSPGTWCRRSPGPVHPVLSHPRRPPPDARNARR